MRRKNAVLHGGGEDLTPQTVLLKNDHMSVQVLLDWGYDRSRYDRGSTVGQVTVNGHTFLSRETDASGGAGLGGIGLATVYEWRDTALYDSISVADQFPLLGVGLLKKGDTAPFLFTRDYAVEPFVCQYETGGDFVTVHTLPAYCLGVAADITKTYSIEKNVLRVRFQIRNVGERAIHAVEFCHNFFRFDGAPVDAGYRVSFPYSVEPRMRRGEIVLGKNYYRIGAFDAPTASSSFLLNGWEGLRSHWMRIENEALGMSVLVEDDFPVCRGYSWNNPNACCPEIFAPIDLESGESVSYVRKYTFCAGENGKK